MTAIDEEEEVPDRQFDAKVKQAMEGIEMCFRAALWEPTLILLYAFIDAMAWLDRPRNHTDVTADDFVQWVEKYVRHGRLTGEDLYGARCGMLHSMTGESKRNRESKARKLFYKRKIDDEWVGIVQLPMNETLEPVIINLDALIQAVRSGIDEFRREFQRNEELRSRVHERIGQSYLSEITCENQRGVIHGKDL